MRTRFYNSDIIFSVIVIATILGYRFTSLPIASVRWESLVCGTALALVLPALFAFQNRFKTDRVIGELSYPIYINHWLMIPLGSYILDQLRVAGTQQNSAFITLLSVLFAVLLNFVVSGPIEHIRRRIRNGAGLPAPPPNSERHDNMPRDALPDLASPQSRA
jgi:peptidoglycan/LPS O-acetylase OafA/YrhL